MTSLFLGIATGAFMSAFVNYKFNTTRWIKTKYLNWIGILFLAAGGLMYFMNVGVA